VDDIPMKRLGITEEVADACIILGTNEYIIGQTLLINGGRGNTSHQIS